MAFIKTNAERKAALDKIHSGSTFYGALIDDDLSSYAFTANSSSDLLSVTGHDFVNGVRVQVSNTGGSLPGGLSAGVTYYVIGVSGNDFQLSATKGGSAINLTSNGSGTNTVTEQTPDATDAIDVWVRHESDYDGSGRQSLTIGSATEANPAIIPTATATFDPATGITYRYFVVIRDGSGTAGDDSGILLGYEDFGSTQTVNATGKPFEYTPQL